MNVWTNVVPLIFFVYLLHGFQQVNVKLFFAKILHRKISTLNVFMFVHNKEKELNHIFLI